jgi:hypothetical protein
MFVVRGRKTLVGDRKRAPCGLVFYPTDDSDGNDRVGVVLIYGSRLNVIGPSGSMLSLGLLCYPGRNCRAGDATISTRIQPAVLVHSPLPTLFVSFAAHRC